MTARAWAVTILGALVVVALVVLGALVWFADDDTDESAEATDESAIAWDQCDFDDEDVDLDDDLGFHEDLDLEVDDLDPELREQFQEAQQEVFADTECATVEVPVDYEDPDRGTLELFVSRRPATAPDPIGPLFVNQGGPGIEAVEYTAGFVADPTFDRFDVIGMDPRGTGRSTRLECGETSFEWGDAVLPAPGDPETPFESAARTHAEACSTDPNLPYFGSNNTARDMDHIRDLLGADQITYHGKSYGSDLGTAYASLFPERLRAAVLDGATDLTLDPVDFIAQQAAAADERWQRYLERCRSEDCAWTEGADPAEAWTALVERLRAEPMVDPDTDDVLTADDLREWTFDAYQEEEDDLDEALDALVLEGDATAVTPDELPPDTAIAFLAITCLDLPTGSYREDAARLADQVPEPHPGLLLTLAACSAWPAQDPITVTDAAGAGPILVTATTGDVPTPYESSVALADALAPAGIVVFEHEGHTAYFLSPCVKQIADAVLVDLELPSPGTRCDDQLGD